VTSEPVIKLLTSSGYGSRRDIAEAIKKGNVTVNGERIESFTHPVDNKKDTITLDGKRLTFNKEARVYLKLNKPKGVISSTESERGEKTVMELLPREYRQMRLYPVGRLDKDSTGLVLLTNDGELTYHLTHPRFEHAKEYLVKFEGKLTDTEKKMLEKGIDLEEGKTSPARVRPVKSGEYNYSITIHEGRKRQIRRMFASLGHSVQELKRIRIGPLKMEDLEEGETRVLTAEEIRVLKQSVKSAGTGHVIKR
jgi:23S rRNA pseudouridine2605 synthase